MRHTAFVALLCIAQLWVTPGLAHLTAADSLASPPLPERHARTAPQGPTLWFLLVDMALHCSGQSNAATPICYNAPEGRVPGAVPMKLQ